MNAICFHWAIDDPDELSARARLSAIAEQLSRNGVAVYVAADKNEFGRTVALGLATYGPDRLIVVIEPDRDGRWRGQGQAVLPAGLAGTIARAWSACE